MITPKGVMLEIHVCDDDGDYITIYRKEITKVGSSPLDDFRISQLHEKWIPFAKAIHEGREMVRMGGRKPK